MTRRQLATGCNVPLTPSEREEINTLKGHYAAELNVTRVNQKDAIIRAVRAENKRYEKKGAKK